MMRKILAATDMVIKADPAVASAFKLAIHNKAKLYILHVLESAYEDERLRINDFRTGEDILSDPHYEDRVVRALYRTYTRMIQFYDNIEILVTPGLPWGEIIKKSRETDTDLIILGPHAGRAAQCGVIRVKGKIGSTVEGVIKHQPCPVWIVNQTISAGMIRLKNVMVAVDFSSSCRYALNFAVNIAGNFASKLFIFHMHGVPPSPRYSQDGYDRDVRSLSRRLKEFSDEMPASIDREYCVRGGSHPHLEISQYAQKKRVDLIVMGSHTRDENKKWYIGSAVEKVSYRAPCPVAVITAPECLSKIEGPRPGVI